MKKFNLTIRTIQLEDTSQSEKKRIIETTLDKNNTTMENTEINIQLKLDHYSVKQKARPIPLHLQKEAGKDLEKLIKPCRLKI